MIKKWLLIILFWLICCRSFGQVANLPPYSTNGYVNYVRTWQATAPVQNPDTLRVRPITDVKQTTQYVDGLGRPIQTVTKQITPAGNDMITGVIRYDQYGREQYDYLPFSSNVFQAGDVVNDGDFKFSVFQQDSSFNKNQFSGETYFYDQINYEMSPLNRVSLNLAPGNSWVGSNRGVSRQYFVNDLTDSVHSWVINPAPGSLPVNTGIYAAGTLYKNVTTDEQSHQTIEYKDIFGHVVLNKTQVSAAPGSGHIGWLNTYYIYDSLQNLRFIIQPKGVQLINTGSSWTVTNTVAFELCFRYEYDGRKRLIIKKDPGAGESWLVYDARDRLVMSQDSNLRVSSPAKWLVTVYDSLDRPVQAGLLSDANNRVYHQNLAYNSVSYPNTASNFEQLSQSYYDDYSWVSATGSGLGTDIDSSGFSNGTWYITSYGVLPYYAVRMSRNNQTRGLLTGSKKEVIGTTGGTGSYIYAESFFDDHNREIQSQSTNYFGGKDTLSTQYDFSGHVLRKYLKHQKGGTNAQGHTVLTKMDYDAGSRLKHIWKNIDNASTDQLIDSIQYNELGQMKTKYLGKGVDSLAYAYNIRAWLTSINKSYVAGGSGNYFGIELGYDKTTTAPGTTTYNFPQYNGNIGGMIWRSRGDGIDRKYDFTYDTANRLAKADFTQNTSGATWDYTTLNFGVYGPDPANGYQISYDANGNLATMVMQGFNGRTSGPINDLQYTYYPGGSNRLWQVWDYLNDTATKMGNFHYNNPSKNGSTVDYYYDGNGNMITDNNRNINTITYNYQNLPQQIHVQKKGTIGYTYDANGYKLLKTTVDSTTTPVKTTRTQYIDDFQYINDTLQLIGHEEGRARWAYHKYWAGGTGYSYEYDFHEKDHLDNNRVLLTQEKDSAQYIATMEAAYRSTENALFYNIPASCYNRNSVAGIPADATTSPNDSIARLNGNGQKIGPAIVLKVMAGDIVTIGCKSFYTSQTGTGTNSSFNDVLNNLAAGVQGLTLGAEGTTAQLIGTGAPLFNALTSFVNNFNPTVAGKPRAYLNWMFMNNQLKVDTAFPHSGAVPVSNYPAGSLGTPGQASMTMAKSGYLFVYVNNETQGWDVFFDNLSVIVYTGPMLEETHYYPFGLTMAGISDKALKANYIQNKYKFNEGTELQNQEFSDGTGLEMYNATYRMYDPQIGRFAQADPLSFVSNTSSNYVYASNSPILRTDPSGLKDTVKVLPAVVISAAKKPLKGGEFDGKSFNDIKDIFQLFANQHKKILPDHLDAQAFLNENAEQMAKAGEYLRLLAEFGGASIPLNPKEIGEWVKKLRERKLKFSPLFMLSCQVLLEGLKMGAEAKDLQKIAKAYQNLHYNGENVNAVPGNGIFEISTTTSIQNAQFGLSNTITTLTYYDVTTNQYLGSATLK